MKLIFLKRIKLSSVNIILMMFGIFVSLYFIFISISWRRFDVFNFLVTLTGVLLIILSFKANLIITLIKKCPKLVQYLIKIFFICFILSFVIIQSIIIFNMRNTSKPGADYVIVLGCQVVGEYASLPLLSRGYTAIRYLNKNPETRVIVTGGQGVGENISEAESLRRLLLENKIDKDRIFLEDKSKNTRENFIFSNELYNLTDKNIIVVTSDYHMFRALSVAKKLKYKNVSGLPSRSQRSVLPAFLLREYVTIMYYKILGKI
jgi:uncharacterized SAM-binding protein YcdF (DUF218 family)